MYAGGITNSFKHKIEYEDFKTYDSIQELLIDVEKGYTLMPALFEKYLKESCFISQQVLLLDFDSTEKNDSSLEHIINNEFIKENAGFIYKTFGHSEDKNRFRVVFVLETPLYSVEEVHMVYDYLFEMFPDADRRCKNVTRHFYSTNKKDNFLIGNILPENVIEGILNIEKIEEDTFAEELFRVITPSVSNNVPIYLLIKEGDLEGACIRLQNKINMLDSTLKEEYTENTFNSYFVASNFYGNLDISFLLEIPMVSDTSCYDILSSEDKNPSASIYYSNSESTYFYKTFKREKRSVFSILRLMRELNPDLFQVEVSTIDFFNTCFRNRVELDINFEIVSLRVQKIISLLESSSRSEEFPEMIRRFSTCHRETVIILKHMLAHNRTDKHGNIHFYLFTSRKGLERIVREKLGKNDYKQHKVKNSLKLLKALQIVESVSDKDKSPKILEWESKKIQKEKNEDKRVLDHLIVSLEDNMLEGANEKSILLDKYRVGTHAISAHTLNSIEKGWGDKAFPQNKPLEKEKKFRKDYTKIEDLMISTIMESINEKNYIRDKELTEYITKMKGVNRKAMVISRVNVLNTYNLTFARASKEVKQFLNIPLDCEELKYAPYIYFRNE